jgi:hypothetical protein
MRGIWNRTTEMKNASYRVISRLDMAEERAAQLEDRSVNSEMRE